MHTALAKGGVESADDVFGVPLKLKAHSRVRGRDEGEAIGKAHQLRMGREEVSYCLLPGLSKQLGGYFCLLQLQASHYLSEHGVYAPHVSAC